MFPSSVTDHPHIRVPVKRPVHFGYVIVGLLMTGVFVNQLSRLVFLPDTVGKVSLLACLGILPAVLWAAYRQRKNRHFYITESQAGFDSPEEDDCPCELDRVSDFHAGPNHISITHDSISVPLGIELDRQHFTTGDWETVRLTLS